MFCPNCKTEYQKGYSTCFDCQVPLIENLVEDKLTKDKPVPIPEAKFIKVLETKNIMDVAEIKTVLEAEGITFYIQNEEMNLTYRSRSARLLVLEDDVERALQLLKDLNLESLKPEK